MWHDSAVFWLSFVPWELGFPQRWIHEESNLAIELPRNTAYMSPPGCWVSRHRDDRAVLLGEEESGNFGLRCNLTSKRSPRLQLGRRRCRTTPLDSIKR